MQKITISSSNLDSSRLVYGCMRIAGNNSQQDKNKGKLAIRAAIDAGYNHFDHADIYGAGECESLFGEVVLELSKQSTAFRDNLIITSKAGIRAANNPSDGLPGRYDFSKEYLLKSVDESLKRLNLDYLDIFLLHRPDYLFNADEVAETFEILKTLGKVNHFGVSNFKPSQVDLLNSVLPMPLVVNQIEINIHNINSLLDGTLDQCQQQHISPLAWCPLGGVVYPAWNNTFSNEQEVTIRNELKRQADNYHCTEELIILAWLLKHPSNILPIIGSTNPKRIQHATNVFNLNYTREDWYSLLEARNGSPVP